MPGNISFPSFSGGRFFIAALLGLVIENSSISLGLLFLLFFLRVLLRNERATFAVWVLPFPLIAMLGTNWINGMVNLVMYIGLLFLLMRFGLVAVVFAWLVSDWFDTFPMTFDTSAWYSGYGYAALAIFAVFVLYAFRFSLGGRPLLAPSHLDD